MGIMEIVKNNKGPVAIASIVGIGVLGWLAFGFFGIQAAFIDNVVEEDGPVFASAAAEVEEAAETASDVAEPEVEVVDVEVAEEPETAPVETEAVEAPDDTADEAALASGSDEAPAEDPANSPAEEVEAAAAVEEPAAEPVEEPAAEPVEEPAAEPVEEPAAEPVEEPAEEQNTPGEIVTLLNGSFSSLPGYDVEGDALVLNDGTEQRFLRFENFVSDNGPDLKVYLRADNGEFISLGDLTGNIGAQNYEIPVDVDLSVFNTVQIWCERFNAGFGETALTAP